MIVRALLLACCTLDNAAARSFPRASSRWLGLARGGAVADAPVMTEQEIGEMLSMVPVFAIADANGRAVLMRKTEEATPYQPLFTDIDVANAHATNVKARANDAGLDLRLATLTVAHAYLKKPENATHETILVPDPRELHVARQLLLRAANVTANFTDEREVEAAATMLNTGLNLENGVPLFTLDNLNATIEGKGDVTLWFMSFADLAQAYIANQANVTDPAASGEALSRMLSSGALTVATLDRVLETMRATPSGTTGPNRGSLIVPPSSSVDLMRKQMEQAQQQGGSTTPVPATADDSIAQAAERINGETDSGGGLFD